MINPSSGQHLLAAALAALNDEIVPFLGEGQREIAHMVIEAISIAIREMRNDLGLQSEIDAFRMLYGDGPLGQNTADMGSFVATLNARLARDIRAGRYDGQRSGALRAILMQQICDRLRIDDPESLRMAGYD
jgi:hypothetical protein